jgi:succinoglycan biosynthesis protein ExoA
MSLVSVIVPCYNEQATIRLLLESLCQQSFKPGDFDVIIADGQSTDQTLEQVAAFQKENPDLTVQVVVNEKRTIPAGLNRAISSAHGEFIVRLDAHSMPDQDYLARCVKNLQDGLGEVVGGVWEIRPGNASWMAKSIAIAASHPLGVGDALYRYTDQPRETDTVPFGAFRRSLVEKVGFYNEDLLTNEDYEFNTRVRQAGGKIWLDPSIRSVYFARSNFLALARQYWRYGYWKLRMLRKFPGTIRWRQALPPLFVASLVIFGLASIFFPPAAVLFLFELLVYLLVLFMAGLRLAIRKGDIRLSLGVPLAIMVMHLSWGSAFLWSLVS